MTVEYRHQRGLGIVTTAFILFVMTMAGAAMIRLSATQAATSAQAALAAQALQSARAGIQREMDKVLDQGNCENPATAEIIHGFTVTTRCIQTAHDEAGVGGFNVWQISSEAVFDFGAGNAEADRVRRLLRATITDRDFP